MTSTRVMPWLVGLPTSEVNWENTPKDDNTAPASPVESVRSDPSGTLRSRAPSGNYDTVAMRSQSASPKRQPTLEWKKRLVRGQLGYGDQTDLFGPSGLENMFVRPQDADSSSQKKHTKMAEKPKLTTSIPSSPPVALAAGDDNSSPRSSTSSSSVEAMFTEVLGKLNEHSQRMQAVKERLALQGCDERMEMIATLEWAEKKRVSAEQSTISYKIQSEKNQHELTKAQRKLFDFTKKSLEAEHRANKAKSEMRRLTASTEECEGVTRQLRVSVRKARHEAEEWQEKYENIKAEVDCLESEGSYMSERSEEEGAKDFEEDKENEDPSENEGSVRMSPSRLQYVKQAEAGAEHDDEVRKPSNNYLAPPVPEHLEGIGSRTITDSELEDLTPVFVSKRTSSNGRITYNAMRNNIIQQRKEIDKTDTSQRARELALAIGIDNSGDKIEGSGLMGLRHISGFTDAPEVETDMPMPYHKPLEDPVEWDFSELPQNESSELVAAHNRGPKRMVSFGETELNDRAFKIVDAEFPSNVEITRNSDDEDYDESEGSPAPDAVPPGGYTPFHFRKESYLYFKKLAKEAEKKGMAKGVKNDEENAEEKSDENQEKNHDEIRELISPGEWLSPPKVTVSDADKDVQTVVVAEAKRPPTSPFRSPTPKRRRTLHDSELQSVHDASVSYHSQLQTVITGRKPTKTSPVETKTDAKPDVLAKRKMARPRNVTPSQGPATKDYINEAKKVIEYLRGNNPTSSPLSGIAESAEDENYEEDAEEDFYNTHKSSDNMRTLGPQAVAHLIGGEVKGMTFDQDKNCWIRSKSSEHKQFLGPRDALSSDDDPFREISDLTVERSVRQQLQIPKRTSSLSQGATTVVHHDTNKRNDTPQEADVSVQETPKLPGEDDTLAHYDDAHESDPNDSEQTTDESTANKTPETVAQSTSIDLPSHIVFPSPPGVQMRPSVAQISHFDATKTEPDQTEDSQIDETPEVVRYTEMSARGAGDSEYLLGPSSPKRRSTEVTKVPSTDEKKMHLADIHNTFIMSDLPEFTINGSDPPKPSEQALAMRLASYSAGEVDDPYALATQDLVKAMTDVEGHEIHWEDLTTLALPDKALTSLHGLDAHCTRVEKLDVSKNALTHLEGIPAFVRQLDVRGNKLLSITSWVNLMHLQYLNLSENGLDSLDGLGHLIHLRDLRVDNNRIKSLDGIADLDGLITLSAKSNCIAKLDFEYYKFERLVELNVEGNNISTINQLERLPSLHKLALGHNSILESLEVRKEMPNLEHISLGHCAINNLSVTFFPHLRTLEVDNNNLSSIEGLSSLKKLELISMVDQYGLAEGVFIDILNHPLEAHTVRLSKNKLPADLELPHILMSVKHLELHNAGIVSLPDDFGVKLPNLRTLNLNFNAVRDIRPLASCQHLEVLSATNCRIERLRKTVATIGKLEKLKKVDVRHNYLTQGFYGEDQAEDETYKTKLDEDTSIRRRTYEMLIAYATGKREDLEVDGMELDHERAVQKDFVWERLMELGVLQKAEQRLEG